MTVVQLPYRVGVAFTHAAVQDAADGVVDALHIKGLAIAQELTDPLKRSSRGTDADVLVRPSHVGLLRTTLEAHGWSLYSAFEDGSSFEHATALSHPKLASLDIHRGFPGITVDPAVAFDRLWRDRATQTIAGIDCPVPSVTAQRLILLLNTARGATAHRDVTHVWQEASEAEKQSVRALAKELGAEVAMAAAIGELHHWTHRRDHDMWYYLSTGTGTAAQLWWARTKAERTPWASLRRGFRLVLPTRHRMRLAAHRELTHGELVAAYWQRVRGRLRWGRR